MKRFILTVLFIIGVFYYLPAAYNSNVQKGVDFLQDGKLEEAFQLFKKASATNNIIAQYYLAQCYEYGIGTDKDEQNAFLMYRRASERGFAPAMNELARCYNTGVGVQQNETKAQEWEKRYNSKLDKASDILDIVDIYNTVIASGSVREDKSSNKTRNNAQVAKSTIHKANRKTQVESKRVNESPTKIVPANDKILSDVDVNIPHTGKVNENTFAFIIANENYQDVAPVANALNDGEIFSEYCIQTLGLPKSNVHLLKDATLGNIKREINMIRKIADAYNGNASFLIYYAGHGIPDEKNHESYILPTDGFTADLSTCFCLNEFYKTLGEIPSKKTVVILDACFSGAQRGDGMLLSARGIAIKAKSGEPKGRTVVISSAKEDETAYPYNEKRHGMFTYFLLKKLKETKGDVTLASLIGDVKENVVKKSIVINGKLQTPTATPASEVIEDWQNWKLY